MTFVTRFSPSPTGPLHLGHAYSALLAHDTARAADGRFLLRIEDIDQSRARPQWETQIYDDLGWIGLAWETPVVRQSDRMSAYTDVIKDLWQQGLLYQCTCNRRDIAAATAPTYSSIYGERLTAFARQDEKITAITAAMPGGTGLMGMAEWNGALLVADLNDDLVIDFTAGGDLSAALGGAPPRLPSGCASPAAGNLR